MLPAGIKIQCRYHHSTTTSVVHYDTYIVLMLRLVFIWLVRLYSIILTNKLHYIKYLNYIWITQTCVYLTQVPAFVKSFISTWVFAADANTNLDWLYKHKNVLHEQNIVFLVPTWDLVFFPNTSVFRGWRSLVIRLSTSFYECRSKVTKIIEAYEILYSKKITAYVEKRSQRQSNFYKSSCRKLTLQRLQNNKR